MKQFEFFLKNQKILVVGGAGFVGSNLCHKLINYDIKFLTIVDNLISSNVDNLPIDKRVNFIKGSISNDKVLKKIGSKFDYVFHLATYHGNQSSIYSPIQDHENNLLTTLKLCELFKDQKELKSFIYSSAGCVVSEKENKYIKATKENDNVSFFHDSPYQISKIVGEFYGNYYWMRHKLPFVKARFQNVYGPREILGAGRWRGTPETIWRNVIPTFIWKAINNQPLLVENNGESTRDFIFIDDIVEGLMKCAKFGKKGETYNLASGIQTTIGDLARLINKITKNKCSSSLILRGKRDWDRSLKRFGSINKSRDQLKFKINNKLEVGLKKTVQWTIDNKSLIKKNIKKHKKFYKLSHKF